MVGRSAVTLGIPVPEEAKPIYDHQIDCAIMLITTLEPIDGQDIDNISRHVLSLTDRLVEGLREKGYRVISAREEGAASGIVAFTSPTHDHDQIGQHLEREHRIIIAVREGRLRVSPHLYNTPEEIDRLVDVLPKH